jgi:outer membrane receptor for ferrienterochelin and colicins
MERIKIIFLIGIFPLFFSFDILSQEQKDKEKNLWEKESNPIVVTGSRAERRLKDSTVATEVISKDRIQQTGARDVAEVLQTQIGINVVPFFGGSQIQMLGLDSKYILMLFDSQRIAGRTNNSVDLTRFKVQNIERIEIVKGSSSALYGADAIGGVINIIPKIPKPGLSGDIRFISGNGSGKYFSAPEHNILQDISFKNENIALTFTGSYNQTPGFDLDKSTPATSANKAFDKNGGLNIVWNPDGKFRIKTGAFYLDRNQFGIESTTNNAIFDRRNYTKDFMGLAGMEYHYGSKNMISFRGNFSKWENHYTRDQRLSNELDAKELNDERSSQGVVQLDHELNKKHMLTMGAESFAEELESDRIKQRNVYRTRRAAYIQDEWMVINEPFKLRLVPGVRYDQDSQFGSQTTPKIAARLDISSSFILRTSYGFGFRPPSFRELYLRFENPGVGYVVEGNNELKPERSKTSNADMEYILNRYISLSAGIFYNSITDLIQYKIANNRTQEFSTFQLVNVNRAYTKGGEFGTQIRFKNGIGLEVGYNYTETRDLTNNRSLEGRPAHQYTMNLIYRGIENWDFFVRTKFVSKRPYYSSTNSFSGNSTSLIESQDPNQNQNSVIFGKAYTILSFRIEKKFPEQHFSLFFGVDNALNNFELTYNPIKPRFYYCGASAFF